MTMDSGLGVTSSARVIPDPPIAKGQQRAANQALRQFPFRRRTPSRLAFAAREFASHRPSPSGIELAPRIRAHLLSG